MAAPTVLDLITDALGEIGVLAAGATPDANQSSHGLRRLNDLRDAWKLEDFLVPFVKRVPFTIGTLQQDYSVGATDSNVLFNGDFDAGSYTLSGSADVIPNGWTKNGSGAIAAETVVVHTVGGSAVNIIGTTPGTYITQEIAASPNQFWSVDAWAARAAASTSSIYVYCPGTAHYLQPAGTWSASRNAFITPAGGAIVYGESTGTFTTEDDSAVESLQVQLEAVAVLPKEIVWDDVSFSSPNAIDVDRPFSADGLTLTYQDTSLTTPIEIPLTIMTDGQWAALTIKTQENALPTQAYYNPTFPNGTLSLWPIPTSTTLQGFLYVPVPLDEFLTISQTVTVPPGHRRMLVKNLAVELAPAYRAEISPLLMRQASESKSAVKSSNIKREDMAFPPESLIGSAGGSTYNIYTDES